ncbi:hypothetical protein [Endothiovibrio diazotrophicus]
MEPQIPTRPLSPTATESRLQALFDEEVVKQNDRLDDLARQLITLELAIPGVYAAALKLVAGRAASIGAPWPVIAAFTLWFIALGGTLAALFPLRRRVDPNLIRRRDSVWEEEPLAIEEFYQRSASRKRGWLLFSTLSFMLGVLAAGFAVLA